MAIKSKILHLNSQFTKELPTADEAIDSIFISGYASSNSPDRAGDVIPSSVWEAGMVNYLKNPIVLAYHDHDDPVGRMVEHKVDTKGLWIKARISAAAEIFNLVKDGVLTAFSVSFRVNDAEYNSVTELFVVKELELIEISVVSVPCNQDTLFSLSKSFQDDTEYKLFKTQFAPKSDSAKGLETSTVAESTTSKKEIGMDPKELQAMLDAAANTAATATADRIMAAQKAEKLAAEKAAEEEALIQKRIKEAVALVTPTTTGAEKLMADIEKRFADQATESAKALDGLQAALKEKADELKAMQTSKMKFTDNSDIAKATYADREKAVILSKMSGKPIEATKFGAELIEKVGAHLPSATGTWELEVSLNMEAEVRRKLVISPLVRQIAMKTNVMTIPVNPEAGSATWMANAAFGTTTSMGTTQTHLLKEITLSAYKVATNEYLAYEEEEDSLIILMPIVRDAMIRRVARAVDIAFGRGAGTGADPVKGLMSYDLTSAVGVTTAAPKVATSHLRDLRKDLGAWGLDPNDVVYVVSTEAYYDLLDDTLFQTMDKVGPKATILTGQIGMVGGSPVLVSAEIGPKLTGTVSTTTNYAGFALAAGNFLVGNQRGLRFDTQDLVETQRKVLVASLRTGLTQVTTNLGQGVSVLRWLNT